MPPLHPDGRSISLGSVTLRTPGLAGFASVLPPPVAGMRADGDVSTPTLETALANEHVTPQETIVIADAVEVSAGATSTRATSSGEEAIELEVADPGPGWGQFVLHADEAGILSWSFARDAENRVEPTRGEGGVRTYVIRRRVPPPGEEAGTRGLIGAVGQKLLKVLAFPLLDPVVGAVGDYFAARWEARKRPYRLRTFTPDDYGCAEAKPIGGEDWGRLGGGRALLLVHGTLSRAHAAFGALPRDLVSALHGRYEGRVFAFDHRTLSEDPRRNVEWFVSQLPEAARLELDIICHSRGGLVSRVLAERQSELSLGARRIAVNRIVFVATPNMGTALADARYINEFLDAYTNLLNLFPDTGAVEVLEAIVTVAKQVATATLAGLDGLQSMCPDGPFLGWLNAGPSATAKYFALTAEFEPPAGALRDYLADFFMDRIFRTQNDLVVPTAGVYDRNGSGCFPIADRREFAGGDGVAHTCFFRHASVQRQILDWLA